MLGFGVRVTGRGGTSLGSKLSNKNLWGGQPCGRGQCRLCAQDGEKKEPCTNKNIVYESECGKCHPPGSRREADRDGLGEKREVATCMWESQQGHSMIVQESTGELQRQEKKKAIWLNTKP